jgi:hypothetical protein
MSATLSLLSFNISRKYSFLTIIPCPIVSAHTSPVFQLEDLIPLCNVPDHPHVRLCYYNENIPNLPQVGHATRKLTSELISNSDKFIINEHA